METSGGAEERYRADLLADDVEHLGDASAAGAPPPKTESATLETTLKEGALDGGAGGSCCDAPTAGRCLLSATGCMESAPVEMPPSLALTTARHGLRVRRARPRAKYGGEPLRVICRYSSILRVLVVL